MSLTHAALHTKTRQGAAESASAPKILAVIVSYNPNFEALTNSIEVLKQQDCMVLLVDNASRDQQRFTSRDMGAQLILNPTNRGLGYAHNQGLAVANQGQFDYLLIMDQDSVPADGMVAALLEAHQQQSTRQKVSAVGACYLNADNHSESFFVKFGALKFQREYATHDTVEADFLISSGSLFSLSALNDIGGMDEALFIDHVDTEWFLRARNKGYTAYGVGRARMQHGLGESTHQVKLGGRQRNVPQHKPFRYYYIFRNSVALYKRGYAAWQWKWNDLQRLGMIFIMFGLLKPPRWQNMRMMFLGVWHGVMGRMGAIDAQADMTEASVAPRHLNDE